MVDVKDLRIGNLVKLSNKTARPREVGKYAEIVAIDSEDSFKDYKTTVRVKPIGEEDSYGQFIVFIEPIIITDGILEKFGFEKDEDDVYMKSSFFYWIDSGHLQISFNYAILFNAPCKYVHQLQNLLDLLNIKYPKINL